MDTMTTPPSTCVSRRDVLKAGAAVAGMLGLGSIIEMATAAAADASALTHTGADIGPTPIDGVVPPNPNYRPADHSWAFVVDTTTCIGCGHCVVACKAENGVPLDGEHSRTWIELHVVDKDGNVHFDSPEAGYHGFEPEDAGRLAGGGEKVAQAYFVPRLCMQCENPPCVNVCPVSATYRSVDGVTLVDENRCIGCGFCMVACPYGARYIVPNNAEQQPKGVAGVVDKCTFCYHRITRGLKPACVEVCPVKARQFGDLNDSHSDVSVILQTTRTQVMKPTLGTRPRVHFIGLESEVG